MTLLAGTLYDPAVVASVSFASASAMTAIDTTNLRLTFTAPRNGSVMVRLRVPITGSATSPSTAGFLGVLEGATVRLRKMPIGSLKTTAVATAQLTVETLAVVTGLTPGASLTWDAACGVEHVIAAASYKWGGPNNASGNNAFGGFVYEIHDCPNLLTAILYDPAVAVSKSGSSLLAMTAFDTTNLRATFKATTTRVLVRITTQSSAAALQCLLGVLDGATVMCRTCPIGGLLSVAPYEALMLVTGLTVGTTYTWDAAYGVEVAAAAPIQYGGPNNTTADDAWGAFGYEVWAI